MKRILIVLISVMMLVACSGTKKEELPQKEETPVETEEVKKLENDKEISNEAKADRDELLERLHRAEAENEQYRNAGFFQRIFGYKK